MWLFHSIIYMIIFSKNIVVQIFTIADKTTKKLIQLSLSGLQWILTHYLANMFNKFQNKCI